METITLRVEADTLESLDAEAADRDVSRSEYVRTILRTRNDHDRIRAEYERERREYEGRIDDLERENDRLREQLRATNRRVDEHQELVEYVEEERRLQQRREERRDAPAWRRAKWWMFGRNRDGEESEA